MVFMIAFAVLASGCFGEAPEPPDVQAILVLYSDEWPTARESREIEFRFHPDDAANFEVEEVSVEMFAPQRSVGWRTRYVEGEPVEGSEPCLVGDFTATDLKTRNAVVVAPAGHCFEMGSGFEQLKIEGLVLAE